MVKTALQRYGRYSIDDALAALGLAAKATFCCDGSFAVLPRAIAWFVTIGTPPAGSCFTRPSVLAWKPNKGARHRKDDVLPPALLHKVHVFCRADSDGPFLYVGRTSLIPQFRCNFETVVQITPKLRRNIWKRLGGHDGVAVDFNGKRTLVSTGAHLDVVLDQIRRTSRADVGLTRYEEDWLHVLFSGDVAFLMYLPQIGDAGMSSRDPKYAGPPDARVVFRSSNGEDTALPARFTIPKETALRAIEHFVRTGGVPRFIHWEED